MKPCDRAEDGRLPVEKASKESANRFASEQYRLHADSVFRKCLMLGGGDRAWAEDVMQDTFMKLVEHKSAAGPNENIGGWLHTVAYRIGINRLRRERSTWGRIRRVLALEPPRTAHTPDAILHLHRELRELWHKLGELAPRERAVVIMKYIEEMSQKEIATALGISEGYVSKLLNRARMKLRQVGWEATDA